MRTLQYEIYIDREVSFVFNNIFKPDVYEQWTKSFAPEGSHYEGEIKQGSTIKFLDATNAGLGGMVSEVIENKSVSFTMSYEIHEGKPKYLETPGTETYHFAATEANKTLITVNLNYQDDYYEMMDEIWQISMVTIKEVLEAIPTDLPIVNFVFETIIERDIEFVFSNIYKKEIYAIWGKAFAPITNYEGEIIKGGHVTFWGGENSGMIGYVSDLVENELIEFTFTSQTINGEHFILTEPQVESYTFYEESPNETHIVVSLHTLKYSDYPIHELWEDAFKRLKDALEKL